MVAAQGGYGRRAGCGPVHAGAFESGAEDGFAAGFDDAGADEHAEFAVVGVAHAVGVGFEVGHGLVDRFGFRAGQVVAAGSGGDRFDVAVVQLGEPVSEPGGGVGDDEREQAGEFVEVFAGVVEVHDLGGFGEALLGEVPDPAGAVAEDDELADARRTRIGRALTVRMGKTYPASSRPECAGAEPGFSAIRASFTAVCGAGLH